MVSKKGKPSPEQSTLRVETDSQGRPTMVRGEDGAVEIAITYEEQVDYVRMSIAHRASRERFDALMGYDLITHGAYVAVLGGEQWVTLSFDDLTPSEAHPTHCSLLYRAEALTFVADHRRQVLQGLNGSRLRQWQREWRKSGVVDALESAALLTASVPNLLMPDLAALMRALSHVGMRLEQGEHTPFAGFLDARTLMNGLSEKMRILFFPKILAQASGAVPPLAAGAPAGSVQPPGLKPPPPAQGWGSVMTPLTPKGCTGWWTVVRSATPCWRIAAFQPPTTWGKGGTGGIVGTGLDVAVPAAMYGAKVNMVRTFKSITYEQVIEITLTVHWYCAGTCSDSEGSTDLQYAQVVATKTVNNVVESGTGRQGPATSAAGVAFVPSAGQTPNPKTCNAAPPHPAPLCS